MSFAASFLSFLYEKRSDYIKPNKKIQRACLKTRNNTVKEGDIIEKSPKTGCSKLHTLYQEKRMWKLDYQFRNIDKINWLMIGRHSVRLCNVWYCVVSKTVIQSLGKLQSENNGQKRVVILTYIPILSA